MFAEQLKENTEASAMNNAIYADAMTTSTSANVKQDNIAEIQAKIADGIGFDMTTLNKAPTEEIKQVEEPAALSEEAPDIAERLRALRA